jgi:hypothetical protein
MKMIKYEDIKKANESIQTTDIKGKNYAEVNQRIKAFRMVYPDGFISTDMSSNDNGVCIFRAEVGYFDPEYGRIVLATGTAYEKEGSTFINKTSYIENCETSAVGRALGMAGFGIDISVASAEEVQNAMLQQKQGDIESKKHEKLRPTDITAIKKRFTTKEQQENILQHFNIDKWEDMEVWMLLELNEVGGDKK